MKRLQGNTISVFNGSSEIISSSLADWSKVRPGSYLRIFEDDVFYTILGCEEYFFIKPFTVESPIQISFPLDDGENPHELLVGDILTLSYKEYELDSIFGFKDKGKDYKKGSCYLDGGILSPGDVQQQAQLNITETIDGGISRVGILNRGRYLTPPSQECELVANTGAGAIIECDFREVPTRNKIEREIRHIKIENGVAYLTLNFALPKNLETGKASVSKWKINLKEIYNGPDKINTQYTVTTDFTPHYGFPLMVKGIQRPDVVFNNFVTRLDQILKDFEEKLKK